MAKVRVGTFNCENLFARFRFRSQIDPANASKNGFTINDTAFEFLQDDEKRLTASTIGELDADILALQEIENFDVLKRFRSLRLKPFGYTHALLIDGNDPRFIDVAVLSRHPIVAARSYQHLRSGKVPLFSRDCLEVDIEVGGKRLTLFVNHFKSMLDKKDGKNGRKNTRKRRLVQAREVKKIVTDRFGDSSGKQPFVVLGDLNDFLGAGQGTTDGIRNLVKWSEVENVVERLPVAERWTHFHETKKTPDTNPEAYKQLDYLLVARSLANATSAAPTIVRSGLCRNAALYAGPRLTGVGDSRPAASDHCAVAITLTV